MTIVVPVPITPAGLPLPDPADRATFSARKLEQLRWANNEYSTGSLALANASYDNAQDSQVSATASNNSAIAAGLSESAAGASATAASGSAGTASAQAASVLNMDKRYLGAKASQPAFDNQGLALQTGANYYDTTTGKLKVWSGSAWVDGITAIAGVSSFNGQTGAVLSNFRQIVTGTTQSGVAGNDYWATNAGATTLTLPATPVDGDEIAFTPANGRKDNAINSGTITVRGPSDTAVGIFLLDLGARMQLKYSSTVTAWVIV